MSCNISCVKGAEVVSLCHSVDNKQSNISAAFDLFEPKFFTSIWAKNYVSKFFFSVQGRGPKNRDLSSYLSHFTRYRSKNWNLSLKLNKKIKIFIKIFWLMAMPILVRINFLDLIDPNLLCILNTKWDPKYNSWHFFQ